MAHVLANNFTVFFDPTGPSPTRRCLGLTRDRDNDLVIMVLGNGNTYSFTVGRLNTIRAFLPWLDVETGGDVSSQLEILPVTSPIVKIMGPSTSLALVGFTIPSLAETELLTSLTALTAYNIHADIFPLPANP